MSALFSWLSSYQFYPLVWNTPKIHQRLYTVITPDLVHLLEQPTRHSCLSVNAVVKHCCFYDCYNILDCPWIKCYAYIYSIETLLPICIIRGFRHMLNSSVIKSCYQRLQCPTFYITIAWLASNHRQAHVLIYFLTTHRCICHRGFTTPICVYVSSLCISFFCFIKSLHFLNH